MHSEKLADQANAVLVEVKGLISIVDDMLKNSDLSDRDFKRLHKQYHALKAVWLKEV